MSTTMWGYLFLLLGVIAGALLIFFGSINTKNEQNYYLLKEITQNAMLDAVDNNAYRAGLEEDEVEKIDTIHCASGNPGTVRIVTEKFIESFARRFAQSAKANTDYKYRVEFYDIQECPAKVTLRVISTEESATLKNVLGGKGDAEDVLIVNDLSGILESKE